MIDVSCAMTGEARALARLAAGVCSRAGTTWTASRSSVVSSLVAFEGARGACVGRVLPRAREMHGWTAGARACAETRAATRASAPHPATPSPFASSRSRTMATAAPGAGGPVGWRSLAIMAATGGGLLYYFERERARRLDAIKEGPGAGKAAIGGPFELRNANADGARFHTSDLHGKYALLYFGFTMCPDICPDELEKMAEAVNLVEKAGKEIVPVFVSIDPERDTVKRVKEYVKEFHPKLLGLTGSVEACKAAAKKYRVYYHKTGDEDSKDYLVDHSIIMYLVDKKGEFVTFYGKNYEAPQMAEAILEQMARLG